MSQKIFKINLKKLPGHKETWLEKLERALNVSEDIKEKFKNGDQNKKKTLVADFGSNLTIKDRMFNVEAENPILRIKKIASTSKAIFKRFEPLDLLANKAKIELACTQNSAMLRDQDSNLEPID